MNNAEYVKYYALMCDNVHIYAVLILLILTYKHLYILLAFLLFSPLMVRYSCVGFGSGDCIVGVARPVDGVRRLWLVFWLWLFNLR